MNRIPNALFILSIVLLVWFTIDILSQTWWSKHINFSIASQYGSFIGGLFSFFTVLLIFFTLNNQIESNRRVAFENKFFSLIGYHRSNIENMIYKTPDSKNGEDVKGQKVFFKAHNEILYAIKLLCPFFENNKLDSIVIQSALEEIENSEIIRSRKINTNDLLKYNIAYLIVFFGVHKEGRRILERLLSRKYQDHFIRTVLNNFQAIPAKWDSKKERVEKNIHFKYFGGHQHRLGHHFRNLFQAVEYVNTFEFFNKKYYEKYSYVKTLRAQFSTYEQSVFFFNSISDIGQIWEFSPKEKEDEIKYPKDNMLITKYNLIKNIPSEFITDVDIKNFYPDIRYEGEKTTKDRKRLERGYT